MQTSGVSCNDAGTLWGPVGVRWGVVLGEVRGECEVGRSPWGGEG